VDAKAGTGSEFDPAAYDEDKQQQQGFSLGPFGSFLSQQLGLSQGEGLGLGFDLATLQTSAGLQHVSSQGMAGMSAEVAVQTAMRAIVSGVLKR
jgi:hypothetical protein